MRKILAVLLLAVCIISCGQSKNKKDITHVQKKSNPNWKTFTGTNFSVQYPPEWELNSTGQMGTSFIILAPLDSADDQFKENINLIIQDLGGQDIDLAKYAEISEKQVKTMVTNGTLIESKKINTDEDEYHRIIFSGDQGMYHLKFEQYYWVRNGKAYVLTLTTEQNRFNDYKERGEDVLNSFTFKQS